MIGRDNTIREHVTINTGTEGGGMVTRIGDHCLLMVGAHVAHDCQIGDYVIMANNATLAGHVVVEEYARLGGLSAVHQFVRIGRHAMVGGMSGVERDVIPYGQVIGNRARLTGLNIIGMQRAGYGREDIQALRAAYQVLFASGGTLSERVDETAERFGDIGPVADVIAFIRADFDPRHLPAQRRCRRVRADGVRGLRRAALGDRPALWLRRAIMAALFGDLLQAGCRQGRRPSPTTRPPKARANPIASGSLSKST